jgi:uncharacterized SAM-binding protein YcdF (DUF218 family)
MSAKKADPDAAPPSSRIGMRPLGAAALATLAWAGMLLLRIPSLFGFDGSDGLLYAAIAGLIIGFTPLRKLLWIWAGLLMIALLVVGFAPIFDQSMRDWVRSDPDPLHPPDAILVLSGVVFDDGHLGGDGVDRLLSGLALAEKWRKPLVISTVRPKGKPGISSALDQNRLIGLAGDSLELYRTDSVRTTHDEALALAVLGKEKGWHTIAVVTSPLHSRRACATVARTGFSVVCLPSESRQFALAPVGGSANRLPAFAAWIYERLGWIEYTWRGWI